MYSELMYGLGAQPNPIRTLFNYSLERAAEVGPENIYNFSLGNPSTPPPKEFTETLQRLVKEDPFKIHGYTASQGAAESRKAIADDLNERFGTKVTAGDLYLTCGAASSLRISLAALFEQGDEAIAIIPYFTEYKVFAEAAGYKFRAVKSEEGTFQLDFDELEKNINEHTKVIIINSPNNPAGFIYTEEGIRGLADLLERKRKEYGRRIYILSDEPYRELVYEKELPFIPHYYPHTLIAYSYSKSLSIPGERFGYVCVMPGAEEHDGVYNAVCGAGRFLGYICAPTLMQRMIIECAHLRPDLSVYRTNRKLLYDALTEIGYECIYPDGAFYICMKALEDDATAFAERAKQFELMLVAGDTFEAFGYVRIAYCVDTDMIRRSLGAFKKLYDSYMK